MPAQDVFVTATVSGVEIANAEDGMGWIAGRAPSQLAVADEGDVASDGATQKFYLTFGTRAVANSTDGSGFMTKVKVTSLNEDVIPNEAIGGVKADGAAMDGYADGANFEIDLSKVKTGSTFLVFNDLQHGRTITKQVTVKPFGEAYADSAWKVKVTVDLSSVSEEYLTKMHIGLDEALTYTYGSAHKRYQSADFTREQLVDGKYTQEFVYIPNMSKQYKLRVAYWGKSPVGADATLNLTIVSGVSKDGMLEVDKDGATITVVVADPAKA